jgi:ferric hydroxamate transport system ATP-binding protein
VHGASVGLLAGAVTALVGPNGSGKSTVLRALARLHRPTDGDVRLRAGADHVDALALTSRDFARRVTLLAQSRPTPTGLSVRDVVGFGRHPYRGRWQATDADGPAVVDRAMAVTRVQELADRPVDELSGGQLQRVWLASCLAQDTGVLLLDEPTNHPRPALPGGDPRPPARPRRRPRRRRRRGVARPGPGAVIADEVALLAEGRVRAAGPPAQVLTAALLSETYGIRVEVDHDPRTGSLRTRPVGRHGARHPGPTTRTDREGTA